MIITNSYDCSGFWSSTHFKNETNKHKFFKKNSLNDWITGGEKLNQNLCIIKKKQANGWFNNNRNRNQEIKFPMTTNQMSDQ